MNRVAQYYRTGEDALPNGKTELLPAHEYGPLVLEYEYLDDFLPKRDVAAVRKVLRAHLYEDNAGEEAARNALNDAQRGEAKKLMNPASPETRAAIERVTAKHADEMAGMSPRGRLKRMTTPVYLLHGEADNIIPSAETLWMASELPGESLQAMLVSPVLSHLDMDGAKPGWKDEWRLLHFFALVMHAAENRSGKG
jgi:pimeloyl-ACP methyl ester carboxylesterase